VLSAPAWWGEVRHWSVLRKEGFELIPEINGDR
jgi:hypothetical protein